jgi:hypothetical protein
MHLLWEAVNPRSSGYLLIASGAPCAQLAWAGPSFPEAAHVNEAAGLFVALKQFIESLPQERQDAIQRALERQPARAP